MKRWRFADIDPAQLAASMLGALALFVMLYWFVTGLTAPIFRYSFENGPILFYGVTEGIMILVSALVGAGFALFADFFIRQETYKPYLLCTAVLMAAVLVCSYHLLFYAGDLIGYGEPVWDVWVHLRNIFPGFLETAFTLPGAIAHFAALHLLLKRKAAA